MIEHYTKGSGITDPYLSFFLDNYYYVSIHHVFRLCVFVRHLNDFNVIYNQNRINQYDIALDKY